MRLSVEGELGLAHREGKAVGTPPALLRATPGEETRRMVRVVSCLALLLAITVLALLVNFIFQPPPSPGAGHRVIRRGVGPNEWIMGLEDHGRVTLVVRGCAVVDTGLNGRFEGVRCAGETGCWRSRAR
ncbi:hypothetical protein Aglo03_57860 [Actinokineospora globicatena]|uniref:Uncharacterized protein n=1 Tax=Actinokineospora globicatena TaxID=103729 RepID=A0A9W6V9C6_9PSEU|nr:hypothetical protein Aglo03_57860 [Actinokineospora globicatena]